MIPAIFLELSFIFLSNKIIQIYQVFFYARVEIFAWLVLRKSDGRFSANISTWFLFLLDAGGFNASMDKGYKFSE